MVSRLQFQTLPRGDLLLFGFLDVCIVVISVGVVFAVVRVVVASTVVLDCAGSGFCGLSRAIKNA